jgi:hypothetical protein
MNIYALIVDNLVTNLVDADPLWISEQPEHGYRYQ